MRTGMRSVDRGVILVPLFAAANFAKELTVTCWPIAEISILIIYRGQARFPSGTKFVSFPRMNFNFDRLAKFVFATRRDSGSRILTYFSRLLPN